MEDYNNHAINSNIEFVRYVLYQSGKTRCYQDGGNCKEARVFSTFSFWNAFSHLKFHSKYTTMQNMWAFKSMASSIVAYVEGMLIAIMDWARYARLYKHLQIPQYETLDTSRAKSCRCFMLVQKTWSKSWRMALLHIMTFCKYV